MNCYLINLDKDKLKLSESLKRLKHVNIKTERIPATYGKGVSDAQIKELSTERIYRDIFDINKRYMNKGAWGCSHSHARTCQQIIASEQEKAIVFEDDFYLLDNPIRTKEIINRIELSDIELVLLGYSPRGIFNLNEAKKSGLCIQLDSKYQLVPFEYIGKGAGGSYSYILSNGMAQRMWAGQTIVDRDADGFGELYEKESVNSKGTKGMYILYPPLIHSSTNDSNIWFDSYNLKNTIKKKIENAVLKTSLLSRIFGYCLQKKLAYEYARHNKVYPKNY